MKQIDDAIETYRNELEAEAELARVDLAELEDHMRLLIADLRATGLSSDQAITAARLRLGDPKLLAREHARVRSPFGAKLSHARAWSAGALFLTVVWFGLLAYSRPFNPWFVLDAVIGTTLGVALMGRLAWARAAVAGYVAYNLLDVAITFVHSGFDLWFAPRDLAFYAMQAGVLAFVFPWRRGEIGPAGYALALIVVMYVGGITAIWAMDLGHTSIGPLTAHVAHLATLAAGIGIVMRARWAAPVAILAAACLALVTVVLGTQYDGPIRYIVMYSVTSGALAAVACTAISWRTARTSLGSLRGFAS